jgi:hypothetical protein
MKILYTSIFIALLFTVSAKSQTCGGEVVKFKETFGTGTAKASLAAGRTNYIYNGTSALADGDYVLSKSSQGKPEWHNSTDHTGDVNGMMMVTNASYTPGEFYRDTVFGVSSVSTYNIYFYAMNVNTVGTCSPNPILPKLQLIVESYNFDGSFTQIYSMSSDFLPQTTNPTWVKISGQFYLPTACTAVRYRIINNSTGGCGNDLAIDDITFSQCNPALLAIHDSKIKRENNTSSSVQHAQLKSYPNPFTSTLNIDIESDHALGATVNVFNVDGKIIYSGLRNVRKGENTIRLTGLDNYPSGMYFINFVDVNGVVISKGKALKK